MAWAVVGGAAIAAGGAYLSAKNNKPSGSATTTQQNQADPRVSNMLFGADGTTGGGLLNRFQGYLDTPQSDTSKNYAAANGAYLNHYGSEGLDSISNTAKRLMGGNQAQLAGVPDYAKGSMVNAPAQNNIDLTGSYKSLLGGGDTSALNNSMNAAVNATNAGFNTNVNNLTNTLQRQVLPGISQNAVLAGQYGGSRQGVAEGNAISDYTNQLNLANTQLAATNSANTTAQAANAYQQGQDRALAATQGLGAQQYGVAQQDAQTKNAAEFMNVGNTYDVSKTNASMVNNMATQNNAAATTGAGLMGGLLGQAGSTVNASDNYGLNRAQGVTSLLAPFIGVNGSTTTSQPLYSNTAGNIIGGATAGLGLYNQYKQASGTGNNSVPSSGSYAANDWFSS